MKVLIAGGGIGGLTTAIALQQRGITCEVYDAAPSNKPLGAGIMLGANAMNVFDKLGIGNALRQRSMLFRKMHIASYKGTILQTIDNQVLQEKYGSATFAIHRAALQGQLLESLQAPVHWGKRFTHATQTGTGVTAHFDDGTSATGDVLIGADGIRSTVREQHVTQARYRYSGQTCWRATVPIDLPEQERAASSEVWGPGNGLRAMYTQVGPAQVYFWMTTCMPAGSQVPPDEALALIRSSLREFPGYMQTVLQHLQPAALIQSDLYDIAPLHQWYNGRIVLMGDAAHATTPNLGQGAGQAIEDAYVLAKWIAHEKTPAAAFAGYTAQRMRRVHRIVDLSWKIARATNWKNPLMVAFRNGIMKNMPAGAAAKQMAFIYGVQLDES